MASDIVNVKIPAGILELFKELYDLKDITNKDAMMYAIATSFPRRGKDKFVKDFNLNEDTFEKILEMRSVVSKSGAEFEFKKINKKLDNLENVNNSKETETLDMILQYLKLSLYDNGFSTPTEDIENIVNGNKTKELEDVIRKSVRSDHDE